MIRVRLKNTRLLLSLLLAGLLFGCAATGTVVGNPNDPVEGFNRAMFSLNEGMDKVLIKPVAKGYHFVFPQIVRGGVVNFFANIDDVFIATNNLLQAKPKEAVSDVGRVFVNTTVGVLGVMDIASTLGLEKHNEDFGQTLGRWGVGEGMYVVLPFFGPRTLRDTVGLALDSHVDPVSHIAHVSTRNEVLVSRLVSDRDELLKTDQLLEEAALDRYSYIRDAYLQRRNSLVHDGVTPRDKNELKDNELPE